MKGVEETKIWKCNKALYVLKNTGRSWYLTFKDKLEGYVFVKKMSDQGLFTKYTSKGHYIQVALCVDDLLVIVESEKDYDDFKKYMQHVAHIKIKDLNEVKGFCGIQFEKIDGGYKLHQRSYIEDILDRLKEFLPPKRQKIPITDYDRQKNQVLLGEKDLRTYQEILGL